MHHLFKRIVPFIIAGIALVAMAFGMVLLAYLFVFGAAVGVILFLINWIRDSIRHKTKATPEPRKHHGRIIDTDDWRKL